MAGNRITLRIQGRPEENGDVLLRDLAKQLESLRKALSEIDRVVSGGDRTLEYRVVDLSHNSPATIVVEAVPIAGKEDFASVVPSRLTNTIYQIDRSGPVPEEIDYPAFESIRELTSMVGSHFESWYLSANGDAASLDAPLKAKIERLLGPDQYEIGEVSGTIEVINIHGGNNIFVVYPRLQPKVRCHVPMDLRKKAISAVDRMVTVFGQMVFKNKERFPHEMYVWKIDIQPPPDPSFSIFDLHGVVSDLTGRQSSDEAVRSLRDEW